MQEISINDTIRKYDLIMEMGFRLRKDLSMKSQITIFVIILILAFVGVYSYFYNPAFQKTIAGFTEEDFSEDNIYSDLESLSIRLDEEIMSGSESFTIYLKDMDTGSIDKINNSLDGIFGSAATYQQVGMIGNTYKKITITIKRTTNYYALKAYTEGVEIPDTEKKAKQLYEAITCIMNECVDETMSDYEKELALHDYLVKNCRYSQNVSQPTGSDIYRAYGALVNGDAVCNGYAEALQLLFMCAGVESRFVIGTADGVDHAWNLVCLDGLWYHLDATWDDPVPDKGETAIHSFFNVTDAIMEKSHTWEIKDYPNATSMNYNYYVHNNLYFEDFEDYQTKAYDVMVGNVQNHFEAVIENYREGDDDMQFIFRNNDLYESVNWQTFCGDEYSVLVLQAE